MLLLLSLVAPFESEEFDEPAGFVAIVEVEESEVSDEPDGRRDSLNLKQWRYPTNQKDHLG